MKTSKKMLSLRLIAAMLVSVLCMGVSASDTTFEPVSISEGEPVKIVDLAKNMIQLSGYTENEIKIVESGIRPGEKLHEQMISSEDAYYTYEYPEHFKILPAINGWSESPERIKDGVRVPEGFVYASDNNSEWMSVDALKAWIDTNKDKIGKI